ncbi:MAG: type VI secretion system tube protein Hcp [Ectothiorhodospiraceae bacterium]|nr:type VI secretion system tube protein Hcp [Ectothiorhodospiraceae bacterium]MCH8504263.1 type VI secretion system tube protein Hcp [Ectothiorhodospiraceae bacterium]
MSIFMNLEDVLGDASDAGHQGWLDVIHIQWGTKRMVTSASSTRGDRESSNAVVSDLEIIRRTDRASPQLFLEACCGLGRRLVIDVGKTGSGSGTEPFVRYTMSNALIKEYRVGAAARDQERAIEVLVVSFTRLELRYVAYDENGRALSPVSVGFDASTNVTT